MRNKAQSFLFEVIFGIILLALCIDSAIMFGISLDAYAELSKLGPIASDVKINSICTIVFYLTVCLSSLAFIFMIIQKILDESNLNKRLEKIENCITELGSVECPNCKAKLPNTTSFCPECGKELIKKEKELRKR